MPNGWIIDVLLDLKSFARLNDLGDLEVQLEQTLSVARQSLAGDADSTLVGAADMRD
ncbi:hypothetical protein [Actibacterium ureilyticum]|uniref:hypothetical protein n=1 Tax=Actibacterium ureilyticum TaxID=1590614 RepID=UPI001595FD7E|nr:hypothetical protein [Actibacterium ureilyticum]